MNYVEKLLKGRKAGAELELSHCDPENPDYDEPRAKRIDEIKQIEKALLILHGVSGSLHADIRNKLSPVANLVAMLEDNAPQEYIDKEMKAVKKSIDYLSNYR